MLSIDFETRSDVDLKACGAYVYASDPSTQVYMMGWAFGDDEPETWLPGLPFPQRVAIHISRGGDVHAWNAQFERLVWDFIMVNDHKAPPAKLEQFKCTAARARAHGMPGRLGECARAMNLKLRKQTEGTRLIREYSAKNVPWEDIPAPDQILFRAYCRDDVGVERHIGTRLRTFSEDEWYEYHLTEHINDKGVPLDLNFARQAARLADRIRLGADGKIAELTGGQVRTARERKTRDAWLLPQLTEAQLTVLSDKKKSKPPKFSFDQKNRDELLADPDLPDLAREYLELVDEAGGASLRKYTGMLSRAIDSRLHGALIFNGAGQTGRFSSTGLQVHNLKRSDLENIEELVARVVTGDDIDTKLLGQLVRSAIYREEGLSWFDWSSIEGRVAPWLAKSNAGEAKLDLYRQGVDPYIYNASKTFGVPMDRVSKEQRQAGKLQELALQFLGGVGALKMMGVNYGMKIADDEAARLRDAWRSANPWALAFGHKLDEAALWAMKHRQQWAVAGRVRYIFDGRDWLWCELPSGRLLAYHKPNVEQVATPWGDQRMAVTCVWGAAKPKVNEPWPRRAMHGGLWLENITQATAADILREAIVRVDDRGMDIVLHVHDEIIIEGRNVEALGEAMLTLPTWATGLPVEGAGDSGERYGK